MFRGRWAVVLGLVGVALACNATASRGEERALTRVRADHAELRRLIREADAASPTFRSLVDTIQRSNAIVIVQFGRCARGQYRACVCAVEGDARQRHIRIRIQSGIPGARLQATIAHELQHAVEIVGRASVVDARSAMALYRRIGMGACRQGLSEICETRDAQIIEARVLDELWWPRPIAQPR